MSEYRQVALPHPLLSLIVAVPVRERSGQIITAVGSLLDTLLRERSGQIIAAVGDLLDLPWS